MNWLQITIFNEQIHWHGIKYWYEILIFQFSINLNGFKYNKRSNNDIWLLDDTTVSTTISSHPQTGSNSNEGEPYISQISRTNFTITSSFMSYPGHSLTEDLPSAEIQSVYYYSLDNWTNIYIYIYIYIYKFPDFFRMGTFIHSTHMKLLSPSK